jgi:hypothetical protein
MRYVMLSYQRPTLCFSLKNLPDECINEIELFVVPSEYDQYKAQPYASKLKSITAWEPNIDMTSKKRKWFCENIKEPFIMLDDDLQFHVWKEGKYHSALSEPTLFSKRFFNTLPSLFDKYSTVGLASKFMADPHVKAHGLLKEGALPTNVFGFTPSVASKFDHNWCVAYIDMSLLIQSAVLSKRNTVTYYGLAYSHSGSKELKTTGMNYRDPIVMLDTVIRFARKFPGIVTGYRMTSKEKDRWLMIKRPSRCGEAISPEHRQSSISFVREELSRLGMSRLPTQKVFSDFSSREEIINSIHNSWKESGYHGS